MVEKAEEAEEVKVGDAKDRGEEEEDCSSSTPSTVASSRVRATSRGLNHLFPRLEEDAPLSRLRGRAEEKELSRAAAEEEEVRIIFYSFFWFFREFRF